MGQLTKEFVTQILRDAEMNERTPLTIWEIKQLCRCWLQWHSTWHDFKGGELPPHLLAQGYRSGKSSV